MFCILFVFFVFLFYYDMFGGISKDIVNCIGEFYYFGYLKMCFLKLEEGVIYC